MANFKRAKSGQKISDVLSAAAFNRIVSATETVEQTAAKQTKQGGTVTGGTLSVINTSGEDVERFQAVALSTPRYIPEAGNLNDKTSGFWRNPLISIKKLNDEDTRKVVVTVEPIPSGKIGRVMVTGVTPAKVKEPEAGAPDEYFGAKPTAAGLELTNAGGMPLIWWDSERAGSGGELAAIIELTTGGHCGEDGDSAGCYKCFPSDVSEITGYDEEKEQALTHNAGCLAWVDIQDCT